MILPMILACSPVDEGTEPPDVSSPPIDTSAPDSSDDTGSDDSDDTGSDDTGSGDTGSSDPERPECPEHDGPQIATYSGCVRGQAGAAVESFLGIPYAEPPVDALRFARTVPVADWESPLEASDYGYYCHQETDYTHLLSEDCLTLNIWRPVDTAADEGLPILFFTHGGGFAAGSGWLAETADEVLLAETAIVVTHNYRLGSLGFYPHSALSDEDAAAHGGTGSSGNQGLFDTLTALQWVAENAEQIGGDPSQVMIFGESAGGTAVCSMLASPLAAGLFSSAIIESGWDCHNLYWEAGSPDEPGTAQAWGRDDAAERGCSGSDAEVLDCLRAISPDELSGMNGWPSVDGVFFETGFPEAAASGTLNPAVIVAGANDNEGVYFTDYLGISTDGQLWGYLTWWADALAFTDSAPLFEFYSSKVHGSPQTAYDIFYGDLAYVCPTRTLLSTVSAHNETYGYFFTQVPSWTTYYPIYEDWGAFHSAELAYVFGTGADWFTSQEADLSAQMRQAWIDVARGQMGDWPLYSTDGGTWMEWGERSEPITGVRGAECDYFDAQGWASYP